MEWLRNHMSKIVSLIILGNIIGAGWVLGSRPNFFNHRVFVGVWVYFILAFIAMAYGLRLVPEWIEPRL